MSIISGMLSFSPDNSYLVNIFRQDFPRCFFVSPSLFSSRHDPHLIRMKKRDIQSRRVSYKRHTYSIFVYRNFTTPKSRDSNHLINIICKKNDMIYEFFNNHEQEAIISCKKNEWISDDYISRCSHFNETEESFYCLNLRARLRAAYLNRGSSAMGTIAPCCRVLASSPRSRGNSKIARARFSRRAESTRCPRSSTRVPHRRRLIPLSLDPTIQRRGVAGTSE